MVPESKAVAEIHVLAPGAVVASIREWVVSVSVDLLDRAASLATDNLACAFVVRRAWRS